MGNLITIIKNSNTWIEGNAVQQLETTAKLPHIRRASGWMAKQAGCTAKVPRRPTADWC